MLTEVNVQKLAPVFLSWMTPKAGQPIRHGQGVLLDHGAVGVVPGEAALALLEVFWNSWNEEKL